MLGRHRVDRDHPVDLGLALHPPHEAAAELPRDSGDEHHLAHVQRLPEGMLSPYLPRVPRTAAKHPPRALVTTLVTARRHHPAPASAPGHAAALLPDPEAGEEGSESGVRLAYFLLRR